MNININVPIKLFERLIDAIEQLADDYATVHASELGIPKLPIDKKVGVTYYQSDKAVYDAEQKEKLDRAASELL